MKTITRCRICNDEKVQNVILLGEQYITSRFPIYGDFSTPKMSITLCMCQCCGLVQLKETTNSCELYEHEYGYRSGISNTMRTHLKQYNDEIQTMTQLESGDVIVDIGSNDSTMLQYYSSTYRRIGVDPTGKQFSQYYGNVELLPTYFTYENFINTYGTTIRPKIVSSICMFYDLPDPVQFAKDIYSILDDEGIWTCEQSYLPTMIATNSIDTICHEHLEYYALHQIKNIADRSGFVIIDVKFNDSNGGSFRVYFAKKTSRVYSENTELINEILQKETDLGIMKLVTYEKFMQNVNSEITKLIDFLKIINKSGKRAYIYGASTKGNCLLQYANIDEKYIKYAVERNLSKVGKMTSTGIEIISEEQMREDPPDYLLVLPWHFRNEIIEREQTFLQNGGQFIFPFANFEIVGSKPKVLITGCDGMIAHYVKKRFVKEFNLYGLTRNNDFTAESCITKIALNMQNTDELAHVLSIVKPDIIIHLASISNSQYAYNNPIETIHANGLFTVNLCDIIHRNGWKTKLFNASSSEIYKGHVDYQVSEDDHNTYHSHPYSIAKTLGHNMIKFYRETYGLPFFNGVIFTTESHLKKPIFLLNKIATHIREIVQTGNINPLTVGCLSSYRNILHAEDVANAIHTVVKQPDGEDYLICNTESHKVYDLVIDLYKNAGIDLEYRESVLYKKDTAKNSEHEVRCEASRVREFAVEDLSSKANDIKVVIIENVYMGFDSVNTNIRGHPTKLLKLGWTPEKSIYDILS